MGGLWIGVDPGDHTGLVAVELDPTGQPAGDRLRHHQTNRRPSSLSFVEWAEWTLDAVLALRRRLFAEDIADEARRLDALPARIAVEYLVPGTPHLHGRRDYGRVNPDGVIGAATQAGYLLGWGRGQGTTVTAVRPGKHGKHQPLTAWYPRELVGPRTRVGHGDKHEHERAALDIARAAPTTARWRTVTRARPA